MAVIIGVSGTLPLLSLLILYFTGPGLGYMGQNLLIVVVAFVFQIPLSLVLGYLMGIKRMRYLERSSELVKKGIHKDLVVAGPFKGGQKDSYITCCVDLVDDDGSVERVWVIPTDDTRDYISKLPDMPETPLLASGSSRKARAYVDADTGKAVAVESGDAILWISPPSKLL